MMTMKQIAQRIRAEAAKEHKWSMGIGGQEQERMLAAWAEMRPAMLTALKKQGVEKLLAQLLDERAFEEMNNHLVRRTMPGTDAQEQSEQNWFLIEPEEQTTPEGVISDLDCLLQRIERYGKQPLMTAGQTTE